MVIDARDVFQCEHEFIQHIALPEFLVCHKCEHLRDIAKYRPKKLKPGLVFFPAQVAVAQ